MTYYNLSLMDGVSNIGAMMSTFNTQSSNLLITMILVIVALTLAITLTASGWNITDVILANGLILTLITALLFAANLAGWNMIAMPLLLLAAGILLRVFGGG